MIEQTLTLQQSLSQKGSEGYTYFEAAKTYLNFGFSVIPLAPNSKRPSLDSWVEFQQRHPTLSEVQTWWQNGQQKGVAIVCGRVSGIVVLDIDDPDKFDIALKTLNETLPDTPIVRTRKGWHVYFRYPANRIVRRHDRLSDWGAELRGDGCYVVAPPTEIDGHRYHWAKRNGRLMALGEVPLADCPDWLLDAFGVPYEAQNEPTPSPQPETQPTNATLSPEARRALKAVLLPHWQEGQRHDLALGLAGLLAKSGIAQDEALGLLREIAAEAQDDEWRDRERALKDTFDRLWKGETVIGFKRLEEILGDNIAALIASIIQPRTNNKVQPAFVSSNGHANFQVLTAADLLNLPAEPIPPLIDGLVFKGTMTVFIGETSVGKTTLFYHMATALAKGETFLNRTIAQPCRVLFIDAETPIPLAQAKLGDLIDPQDEAAKRFYWLRLSGLSADDEQGCAQLLETVKQIQPDAIFVDPLNAVMLVEDFNDEAEARKQLLLWKRIADELGCAVILSAHPPKDRSRKGAARWRGSFARAEIVDIAYFIEGNFHSDTLTFELVKDRTGCAIGKLTLRKTGGFEIVEGADEDAATRWILKFVGSAHKEGKPEVSRAEIFAAAKEAGWAEKTIANRLTALVQTARLERPRRGFYRLPANSQSPEVPTPNPRDLQDNESPKVPNVPQGLSGLQGLRDEEKGTKVLQVPQTMLGTFGTSGTLGTSGTSETSIDDQTLSEVVDLKALVAETENSLTLDTEQVSQSNDNISEIDGSESVDTDEWLVSLSTPPDQPCESLTLRNVLSEQASDKGDYPPSPCCGEPLEPDPDALAVCVGCGRLWRWQDGTWQPEPADDNPFLNSDPPEFFNVSSPHSLIEPPSDSAAFLNVDPAALTTNSVVSVPPHSLIENPSDRKNSRSQKALMPKELQQAIKELVTTLQDLERMVTKLRKKAKQQAKKEAMLPTLRPTSLWLFANKQTRKRRPNSLWLYG